ncbi:hypothetical protein DdX_01838 [Ditylenchus destructor]|uniref:Uncharacterized protein n=1 Tax=Ditylenchus destructor TaxID=166010 RepID=A0AAD4R8F9_9BILA|nr:hypothetical protein DdX_01838 [Ditylenchus destructor]
MTKIPQYETPRKTHRQLRCCFERKIMVFREMTNLWQDKLKRKMRNQLYNIGTFIGNAASNLGSGRVTCQSLPLGEGSRLLPASPGRSAFSWIYGSRKSGNPGFGAGLTPQSQLGSGRVICQSLPLSEGSRLVPVSPIRFATTGIYGFRKSGKFGA